MWVWSVLVGVVCVLEGLFEKLAATITIPGNLRQQLSIANY